MVNRICKRFSDADTLRHADLGEFEEITSGSGSRSSVVSVDVVEGNVAVIPCAGIPPSRPSAVIEFLHNGVKVTQSGLYDLLPEYM